LAFVLKKITVGSKIIISVRIKILKILNKNLKFKLL